MAQCFREHLDIRAAETVIKKWKTLHTEKLRPPGILGAINEITDVVMRGYKA
jgi:hypothetical protein